jgi:hypothetical protein
LRRSWKEFSRLQDLLLAKLMSLLAWHAACYSPVARFSGGIMMERTWQDVCHEISREYDSERLLSLIEELNRKLDQNVRELRAEVRPQEL